MAGLVGPVNDSRASSESIAPSPSSRYVGLNAIVSGSPSNDAGSASAASASSRPPASSTTPPSENDSRTGDVREATSETRRTASVSAAASTPAVAVNESGSSERYFG